MDVDVTTRGQVAPEMAHLAAEKIAEVASVVQEPLDGARVVLTQEENPRIARAARAEGEVRLRRTTIRGRVEAEAMEQAIHDLADRLRQQLRRHVDRLISRSRVPAEAGAGEWQRGRWTPPQPPRSFREPGEREVIRRKTFALDPVSAAEAAADMDALDHDFYLFRDVDAQADAVVYRRDDGRLGVIVAGGAPATGDDEPVREPSRYSEPLALGDAVSKMDALNHRFLFFTDAASGRGAVLYLRYDGHYGLIEPAA
ncbi:MAG: sigma 54 modulation/S30EA ribosomal C-terminal domain-containing protein [Solirubrobacteraceae bacterium]